MKKVLLFLLVATMVFSVVSCADPAGTPGGSSGELEGNLEDIMEKIYEGFDPEFPETQVTEIDDENVEYFLGTDEVQYEEAIASEPMISPHAHSIVLLRTTEDADIGEVKEMIKDNVDGRKWICVGVEDDDIIVDNVGNLVILIMDDDSESIHESFLELIE